MFKDVFSESSSWACGKCKVIMTKINARLGELEKKVDGVKADVEEVKTGLQTAATERKEIQEKTASLGAKIASNTNNVKAASMNEAEQRDKKRKNVVLYGVPESTSPTTSERIAHDKEELTKVLNIIGASEPIKQDGALRMYRSGKKVSSQDEAEAGSDSPGPGPRPLVVELKSEEQREELLSKSRVLREDDDRMKPDLTKMQRDKDKALRTEVDDLNKAKPRDDQGNFHWRIAGPPGQLRKVKVREENQPRRSRHWGRRNTEVSV